VACYRIVEWARCALLTQQNSLAPLCYRARARALCKADVEDVPDPRANPSTLSLVASEADARGNPVTGQQLSSLTEAAEKGGATINVDQAGKIPHKRCVRLAAI